MTDELHTGQQEQQTVGVTRRTIIKGVIAWVVLIAAVGFIILMFQASDDMNEHRARFQVAGIHLAVLDSTGGEYTYTAVLRQVDPNEREAMAHQFVEQWFREGSARAAAEGIAAVTPDEPGGDLRWLDHPATVSQVKKEVVRILVDEAESP